MIFFIVMLFACKSDIKKVSVFCDNNTLPEITAKHIKFIRSDSGKVQAILTSPLMVSYGGAEPYMEFPEGFEVVFYDSLMNIKSFITADFGINYEKRKLMEAKNNVVIINKEKQEQLNTEHIIWDQRKKIIYSYVPVKITTPDEIIEGDTLIASETFDKWEIKNTTGIFEIEDEENN